MLDYNKLAEDLKEVLPVQYKDFEFQVDTIKKTTGSYTGLRVLPNDSDTPIIAPVLNLDSLNRRITAQHGESVPYSIALSEVAEAFQEMYEKVRPDIAFSSETKAYIDNITDFNAVKSDLIMSAVAPLSSNLENPLRAEIAGVSFVPKLKVPGTIGGDGFGTIVVSQTLMDSWNVSADEIIATAFDNIKSDYTVQPMREVLMEMMAKDGMPMELLPPMPDDPMTIFSNKERVLGASALFAPGVAKEVAGNLYNGEDFIILPSSIHECILLPKELAGSEAELSAMVNEVNSTQVEPGEQLANVALYYDADKDCIDLYSNYELNKSMNKESSLDKSAPSESAPTI